MSCIVINIIESPLNSIGVKNYPVTQHFKKII